MEQSQGVLHNCKPLPLKPEQDELQPRIENSSRLQTLTAWRRANVTGRRFSTRSQRGETRQLLNEASVLQISSLSTGSELSAGRKLVKIWTLSS